MNKKFIAIIILSSFYFSSVFSQSYYFGLKGGPSFGYQKWETYNQSPVLTYHVSTFIESYSDINPMNALYAQLGFHNRGSALRGALGYTYDDVIYRLPTKNFIFKNISLALGAKRRHEFRDNIDYFYSFGLRAEYTIGTNLEDFTIFNQRQSIPYYPDDLFVKKFLYGAQVGGGLEFAISELIEGLFELTINPDLSNQYDQPQIGSIIDPYRPANTITIDRRRIKNTTIEVTFGIRFMRKVVYVD